MKLVSAYIGYVSHDVLTTLTTYTDTSQYLPENISLFLKANCIKGTV